MTEDETAAELSELPASDAKAAAEADPNAGEGPDAPVGSGPEQRRRRPRWPLALAAVLFLLAGLSVVLWFVTLPYYALWPGPVEEVSDLVKVEGAPAVYELNGGVYLLTVSLQEVNAFALAQGWLDPEVDLVARKAIRPEGVTPEQHRRNNLRMMDNSKDRAIAAAFDYLGWEYEVTGEGVLVVSVVEGSPADGLLEAGDVIVEVGGIGVEAVEDGIEAIRNNRVGDAVRLTVQRGGQEIEAEVTLAEHTDDPGRPMVGFVPGTYNPSLELPFGIEIETHGIGGPSAGVMYALTLVDLLTEGDLVGGNVVAGTGTISAAGEVGPIGGVRQKVVAAQDAGARHVLVPDLNYEDAVTVRREGVEIYPISTLDEAVGVLEGISPVR